MNTHVESAIIGAPTPANAAWRLSTSGRGIKHRAMAMRAYLLRRFPDAFMPFHVPKIPLKIGICKDILLADSTIERRKLWLAMNDYCSGRSYLRALVAGAPRINLDGDAVDIVTPEQAARAAAQLALLETPL